MRFPREAFTGALKRAGIHDFRFHDLRHTAASYLAMSGATLSEIAQILEHKILAMVNGILTSPSNIRVVWSPG